MPNETKTASSKTKIAVVTGGTRGLGKSTGLALADRGVNSIFTFVSKSADAEHVVSAATKVGATEGAGVSAKGVRPQAREFIKNNNPMQRMATLEDVANAAEYLAGDLSAYVSGQHLLLSGGAPA